MNGIIQEKFARGGGAIGKCDFATISNASWEDWTSVTEFDLPLSYVLGPTQMGQPSLLRRIYLHGGRRARRTLIQEMYTLSEAPHTLLVYATDWH